MRAGVVALALMLLAATVSRAMDVVLLVDTSGSMGWDVQGRNHTKKDFSPPNRIERVTKALKDYITQLGKLPADQGVRLRLISFNSGVKTNKEFHLSNPQELKAALSTVESFKGEVKPDGDTWLWEAMRTAISESEKYAAQDPDITVCLYVMTDGEYDNKSPGKESDISFAKVIGESKYLGTDSLYGSLVLMGKVGVDGGFGSGYVDGLKQNSGGKFDVQISDDFTLLLPPVIQAGTIVAGQPVTLMDRSPSKFSRYEWLFDGKPVEGSDRTFDYTFPKNGRYVLTVNAYDDKGRRARTRKVINVSSAPVTADTQVTVNGKSLADAGEIHPGDLVTLVSKNTSNVAEFAWDVNGEKLSGQTVQWKPSKIGSVKIRHSVSGSGVTPDDVPRSEAPPITFSVVNPHLNADPQVTVNGKPLAEAGEINPGATITLVSRNTANAEQFLWEVNGEKLSGQTVEWHPQKAGKVSIIHSIVGKKDDSGDAPSITAPKIQIDVVNAKLAAKARILDHGKPIEKCQVMAGDTLSLISDSTGPVTKTAWKINDKQTDGTKIDYLVEKPGKIVIELLAFGPDGTSVASGEISILATKKPAYWSLFALGIIELCFFGFAIYRFSKNSLKYSRLEIFKRNARTSNYEPIYTSYILKYWNHWQKKAIIRLNKLKFNLLIHNQATDEARKYFLAMGDDKYLTISSEKLVLAGPDVSIQFSYINPRRGHDDDYSFQEPPNQTKLESRYYEVSDLTQAPPMELAFKISMPTRGTLDWFFVLLTSIVLLGLYFVFYIKFFPKL
jgi:hypothetical protein